MLEQIIELCFISVIFIGVLWLTYFVTKKIGMFNKGRSFHKNMEIVEVLPLMQGQYLYIVKVGEAYYLIGCAQKGNITYLNEIEAEKLDLQEVQSTSFQTQFLQLMKGKRVSENEENKQDDSL